MTNYYNEQLIHEIENKIDIIELISETVTLNRKGNRYWGLCPFHQEKTPSFSVTRDKQMFYCFGCHTGGNIFSFVMKKDNVDFKEAVQILAAKAGIRIISSDSDNKNLDRRKQIIQVNNAALTFYRQQLSAYTGHMARNYLEKREISSESIDIFKLGYATQNWDNLKEYLLQKGFSLDSIKDSGLIKRSDKNDSYYDLFRERIIFPICQYNGDVIGFGGRATGKNIAKYINSPETSIFAKRRNLYGIVQAASSIRDSNEAILVEGYIDCIKLHQAGIKNVIASLGTAFTEEQAKLLHRYTENVLIIYDGDEAGQRETLRAIDILEKAGVRTNIVSLPGDKDPDEFVDLNGKKGFLQYIKNNKVSTIEFKLNRYLNSITELNLESKVEITNALRNDINALKSTVEREYYIRLLAQRLGLEEDVIRRDIKLKAENILNRDQKRNKIETIRDNYKYGKYKLQEKILAAMLIDEQSFLLIKDSIGIKFFSNSQYKEMINMFDQINENYDQKLSVLTRNIVGTELEVLLAKTFLLIEDEEVASEIEIKEFIHRVKKLKAEAMWKNMLDKVNVLEETGDFNAVLTFILKLDRYVNMTREGGI